MQQNIIIAVCIVLTVVGLWLEWKRPAKAHLTLRLLAVTTAVFALACLILPLSYTTSIKQNSLHEAILLTDGFNDDTLSRYSGLPVYTLENNIRQHNPKVRLISDAGILGEQQPAITLLHLLGNGLTAEQLQQLEGIPVDFHPPVPASGIHSINFTAQINTGEQFKAQGQYRNTLSKAVKLKLIELGTVQDSVTIPSGKSILFNLTARPKHIGKALYRLLGLNGADTLSNELLPATINPVKPLKVLLLSATPDFENKFLKNWLSANGYGVAVRSAISKGKTSTGFVNVDKQSLDRLTASTLSRFDAVTADAAALQNLTPAESAALYQQISQQGLGLIIRADSSKAGSGWWQKNFRVSSTINQKPITAKLNIANEQQLTSSLSINPNYLNLSNAQPVVTDAQQHLLAANRLTGEGHIIFTTLTQTYPWALAGNQKDYTALWTTLINKAARKQPTTNRWLTASTLPAIGKPVTLRLQTGLISPAIRVNQTFVAQSQQAALPFVHDVTYWPEKSGWQQAGTAGNSYNWYAFQKNDWLSLRTQQKIDATKIYVKNHLKNSPVTKIMQQKIRIEVPKFYFYILLLLAFAYLWAESRWFS